MVLEHLSNHLALFARVSFWPLHSIPVAYISVFMPRPHLYFLFKILFIYLTERDRIQRGGAAEAEGEAVLPAEQGAQQRLDPRNLGS